jgi:hypothetical protein
MLNTQLIAGAATFTIFSSAAFNGERHEAMSDGAQYLFQHESH